MICKAVLGWLPDDLCYWAQRMRQFASNVSLYLEMLGIRLLSSCPAKRTTTIDSCKMRRNLRLARVARLRPARRHSIPGDLPRDFFIDGTRRRLYPFCS